MYRGTVPERCYFHLWYVTLVTKAPRLLVGISQMGSESMVLKSCWKKSKRLPLVHGKHHGITSKSFLVQQVRREGALSQFISFLPECLSTNLSWCGGLAPGSHSRPLINILPTQSYIFYWPLLQVSFCCRWGFMWHSITPWNSPVLHRTSSKERSSQNGLICYVLYH